MDKLKVMWKNLKNTKDKKKKKKKKKKKCNQLFESTFIYECRLQWWEKLKSKNVRIKKKRMKNKSQDKKKKKRNKRLKCFKQTNKKNPQCLRIPNPQL